MSKQLAVSCFCTRNRKEDLLRAITSFFANHPSDSKILVVDSSDSPLEHDLEFKKFSDLIEDFTIITSDAGLTLQRNIALTWGSQAGLEIIHFFDDDVTFDSNYLGEVEKFLETNTDYVGAGGRVRSPGLTPVSGLQVFQRLRGRPGTVNRAGDNRPVKPTATDCDVDWLPGCAMSFRLGSAANVRFDESRTGYGLGEDVDFSLRVKNFGKLKHLSSVSVIHHLSPVNRYKVNQIARDSVEHRFKLSFDFNQKVSPISVVISIAIEMAVYFLLGASLRRSDLIDRGRGLLSGLIKEIRQFFSTPDASVYVLNGGLGNQLFILAAALAESKAIHTHVYLDTSAFSNRSLRSLELSKFKLPSNVIFLRRRAFFGRYYQSRLQRVCHVLLKSLKRGGSPVKLGYFQDKKYPDEVRSQLLAILRSAPVSNKWTMDMSRNISCICHVRAGDYLLKKNVEFHGLLPKAYFSNAWAAINAQEESEQLQTAHVICDSHEYLASLKFDFNYVSLETEQPLSALEILVLMSRTPSLILSNSSLSWWGAYWAGLEGVAKTVIAPEQWYVDADPGDIYENSWKRIGSLEVGV
ncbi:MAG: hypothetical protein RL460_640 [Actinomycetota bacterium]|jgi:GT2 family glycosyltransferase